MRRKVFGFFTSALNLNSFEEEVQFMARVNHKKSDKAKVIVSCWVEMLYGVWLQRNNMKFQGKRLTPEQLRR